MVDRKPSSDRTCSRQTNCARASAIRSVGEYGLIFAALGLLDTTDPERMRANIDARCSDEAETRREAIRVAIEAKKYEFDARQRTAWR